MSEMPINQSTNQLVNYLLSLADDALIMSQRLSEWTGHGPVLEQDIAMTNIALDYLGQSRNFYQYAASILGNDATEDSLAMMRMEQEYRNHLLVELPNGNWAQTLLKIYFFSAYQQLLMQQLEACADATVSGIAAKSLKEVNYHLRWSREWVLRLGDGTEESHAFMVAALDELWVYSHELFEQPAYHQSWVDYVAIQNAWLASIHQTLAEATISIAGGGQWHPPLFTQRGGLEGRHTEHLGYLLTQLQYMQRAYPNSEW